MVTCDIFPDLALRYAAQLSVPLAAIFNRCFAEKSWPSTWKAETVVVIPKTDAPEGLNDLRNLSCTPLFSKLMEFFVLEQLKKETKLRSNQYGGRKGSSCEHYIIKLLAEIHETLDQKDSVCNLLAVDFPKAFNTMDHAACLSALRDNGASEYMTSIVRSFLANRTMNVRIGSTLSSPRPIRGGSPQGTLLGNLLFTLSTNKIEDSNEITDIEEAERHRSPPRLEANGYNGVGCTMSTPVRIERSLSGLSGVSDIEEHDYLRKCERTLRYDMSESTLDGTDEAEGLSYLSEQREPEQWNKRPMITVKFIDDLTAASGAYLPNSYQILSENKPRRILHAKDLQNFYNTVSENAGQVGLRVNSQKTQLLCVSSAKGCNASSYINVDGNMIESQESLKVLGFHLSSAPGMGEQVFQLQKKFRARAWVIRNLKRAGLESEELVAMYKCLVRPILDYMAPVYHTMLTQEQSYQIEKLQMGTLKTIFNQDSYRNALEKSGLQTLHERRQECFDRFAIKLANNEDYKEWLPQTVFKGYNLREELIYVEKYAATDRLRNSPLYAMRRRLNEIYLNREK